MEKKVPTTKYKLIFHPTHKQKKKRIRGPQAKVITKTCKAMTKAWKFKKT
jgi:hypothetical protein